MFQNLLKTLLGGAGQGVQKIAQVYAAKPTPAPVPVTKAPPIIYSQLQSRPVQQSSTTNPKAQGYQIPNYVQQSSATNKNAAGYVAPSSSPSGGSSGYVAPTIFRNSISSLLPKVYATNGQADLTGKNPIVNAFGPLATLYSSGRQFLQDQGIIGSQTGNFGQLMKNIVNPHTGSWGTTDVGLTEFISPFEKGFGTGQAVNKLMTGFQPMSADPNAIASKQNDMNLVDEINRIRNGQVTNVNKDITGGGSLTGGGVGGGARSANSANAFSDVQTALDAIDQSTNQKLDSLYSQMANGQITEEEYRKAAAQAEADANSAVYDQLIANQQAEVPLINSEFQTSSDQLTSQIPTQEALAAKAKTNATNTYGDVVRQTVLNKDASLGNLRNMFASLGTAESSAFINKAGELTRSADTNVAKTQSELADKITTIDSALNDFKSNIQNQVNSLNLERLKQIKTVQDNVNMSQAQKAANIQQINAQMYKDLVGIKQYHDQQTNAFINLKQQLVANSDQLMKNAVISNSLYNRVSPVQTYDSGVNQNTNTRTVLPNVTTKGVKQFDPITGKYFYLDLSTGAKTYV